MKLSLKIFLGIFIPSMISIFIISFFLLDNYVESIKKIELEKSYNEFNSINSTIKGESYNNSELKSLLSELSTFFQNKRVNINYYRNNNLVYSNNDLDINEKLVDVKENKYNSYFNKTNGDNHLFISIRNNNSEVIVFSKNINNIYDSRDKLISICLILSISIVIIILVVAYIISKTLSKPLKKIEKEVKKVSLGEYDINIKEGKDEIGSLAHSINIMSKEIKNRNEELLSLIENKQLFIDNLSHEMNTPLTSIYGYIELFEKANLDDEQKYKALSYMKGETKRIIDMQSKLLMLSYKENTNIDKVKINLDNVLEHLNTELSDKLNNKNIKLHINNNIEELNGDELLVSLAISNLIRNAINNSESNTNITINTYTKDNYNYVEVSDEGIGISEEDIKKITEPFYRVDKARSRQNGGAGLGLSIVKKIMNIHNGELLIESKIGEGSTFILKFPL